MGILQNHHVFPDKWGFDSLREYLFARTPARCYFPGVLMGTHQ